MSTTVSSSRGSSGYEEVEVSGRGRNIRTIDLPAVFKTAAEREMLSVITAFDLSRNELVELTNLQPLRSLLRLNVSYNHIRRFSGLPLMLTQLNMAHNKLDSLDSIGQLTHLRELDVSFNRLTSLAGLTPRVPLEVLKADDNCMNTTVGLEGLPRLRVASLSNNYIESTDELFFLPSTPSLQLLSFTGNPVTRARRYRAMVAELQPSVVTLDGAALTRTLPPRAAAAAAVGGGGAAAPAHTVHSAASSASRTAPSYTASPPTTREVARNRSAAATQADVHSSPPPPPAQRSAVTQTSPDTAALSSPALEDDAAAAAAAGLLPRPLAPQPTSHPEVTPRRGREGEERATVSGSAGTRVIHGVSNSSAVKQSESGTAATSTGRSGRTATQQPRPHLQGSPLQRQRSANAARAPSSHAVARTTAASSAPVIVSEEKTRKDDRPSPPHVDEQRRDISHYPHHHHQQQKMQRGAAYADTALADDCSADPDSTPEPLPATSLSCQQPEDMNSSVSNGNDVSDANLRVTRSRDERQSGYATLHAAAAAAAATPSPARLQQTPQRRTHTAATTSGSVGASGRRFQRVPSASPVSLHRSSVSQDMDLTAAQLHDCLVAKEQLEKECQALLKKVRQLETHVAESRRVISQQLGDLSQLRLERDALRQSEADVTERLEKERRSAKARAAHHAEEVATLQGQYERMKTFYETQLADTRRELATERSRLLLRTSTPQSAQGQRADAARASGATTVAAQAQQDSHEGVASPPSPGQSAQRREVGRGGGQSRPVPTVSAAPTVVQRTPSDAGAVPISALPDSAAVSVPEEQAISQGVASSTLPLPPPPPLAASPAGAVPEDAARQFSLWLCSSIQAAASTQPTPLPTAASPVPSSETAIGAPAEAAEGATRDAIVAALAGTRMTEAEARKALETFVAAHTAPPARDHAALQKSEEEKAEVEAPDATRVSSVHHADDHHEAGEGAAPAPATRPPLEVTETAAGTARGTASAALSSPLPESQPHGRRQPDSVVRPLPVPPPLTATRSDVPSPLPPQPQCDEPTAAAGAVAGSVCGVVDTAAIGVDGRGGDDAVVEVEGPFYSVVERVEEEEEAEADSDEEQTVVLSAPPGIEAADSPALPLQLSRDERVSAAKALLKGMESLFENES